MATGGEIVLASQLPQPAFTLLGTIGRGSFGVVRKAYESCSNHPCAIKFLQQPIPDKADKRFETECKLMSAIRHDNIVLCLGVIDQRPFNPYPYLVMELMDCNLRQYLEASPIRFSVQIDIASNIFQAIAFLHKNKIIHRDLSSANVLMKGNIAKITDFGMARLFPDVNLCDLTGCPGTVAYMPPEAFNDPPLYDEKIDIFSAGVLLVQIQTRRVPKADRRDADIAACEMDNPLRQIALLCLRFDKKDRPPAIEICEALIRIQKSDKYQQDKLIIEKNLQLSLQYDVLQALDDQTQVIARADQTISTLQQQNNDLQKAVLHLQSQVTELRQDKNIGIKELAGLQSNFLKLKCESNTKIQNLQSRVNDLETALTTNTEQMRAQMQAQMQEEMQKLKQSWQQQVDDHLQHVQSTSDVEKQQLENQHQQEKRQLEEEKRRLEEEKRRLEEEKRRLEEEKEQISHQAETEIIELKLSLSTLSLSSSLNFQDSLNDQHLSKSLSFEPGEDAPKAMHRWSSAVVLGDAMYVTPARTQLIYKYSHKSWGEFSHCPAGYTTLAVVDGNLVTIGGQYYSKHNPTVYTNALHTWKPADAGSWVEELPPMKQRKDGVIVVTTGKALVVAGGRCSGRGHIKAQPSATVEILSIETKTWQYASSLLLPLYCGSASICGDSLFITGAFSGAQKGPGVQKSVLTCKLVDLILSLSQEFRQSTTVWKQISDLPVSRATCVSFQGHLLAVGGMSDLHEASNIIYCYDEKRNSWTDFCQLTKSRELCFAVALNDSLFVFGGREGPAAGDRLHSSMEIGTLQWS